MKRTRLLYILHDIQIGGVEVALLSAIPELNKQFELKIMALGSVNEAMTAHLTPEEKACIHTFDYSLKWYPAAIFKMLGFIFRFAPDVMICSLWRASLVGATAKMLRPNLRLISFIHNTRFFHKFDELFSKRAIRHADAVFTDSEATAVFVRTLFRPAVPVKVISFFTSPSPSQKNALPLDNQDVRFMYLGRINAVKNLPLAVDTIKYLTDRGINASLDIFGRDDGMLDTVMQQVRASDLHKKVQFKGEVNGARKLETFPKYNCLIQLSTNEGMAMSVAEAMQNGLVCFVTAVGEIPNYAKDMETAVFADISTTQTFEESLKKLETVVTNPVLYDRISSNSYAGFKTVGTYQDSLIRAIRESL